jgi:hypothetical protein
MVNKARCPIGPGKLDLPGGQGKDIDTLSWAAGAGLLTETFIRRGLLHHLGCTA